MYTRIIWAIFLMGCADEGENKGKGDSGDAVSGLTFYQDVLPVIGENCQGCHNTDDNPFLKEFLGGAVEGGVTLGEATEEEMCLVAVGLACEGLCP